MAAAFVSRDDHKLSSAASSGHTQEQSAATGFQPGFILFPHLLRIPYIPVVSFLVNTWSIGFSHRLLLTWKQRTQVTGRRHGERSFMAERWFFTLLEYTGTGTMAEGSRMRLRLGGGFTTCTSPSDTFKPWREASVCLSQETKQTGSSWYLIWRFTTTGYHHRFTTTALCKQPSPPTVTEHNPKIILHSCRNIQSLVWSISCQSSVNQLSIICFYIMK